MHALVHAKKKEITESFVVNMVAPHNPCCPVSLGFIGFLSAILSRRSSLFQDKTSASKSSSKPEEEEDLLAVGEADCDEITDDRITSFLESQKQQYYRSIGMAPPKQLRSIETSTTPGASMIEFSSSRETSYVEECNESGLLSLEPVAGEDSASFTPQTFRMDEDSDHDPPVDQSAVVSLSCSVSGNVLESATTAPQDLLSADLLHELLQNECESIRDDSADEECEGFTTPISPQEELVEDTYLSP